MPAALEEKAPETTGAALAAKKAVPAEKEAPLAEKEALPKQMEISVHRPGIASLRRAQSRCIFHTSRRCVSVPRVPVRFLYLCIQLLRRRRCLLQHPQKPLSIRAGFFTPFAVQPLPCFSEYSGKIQRNNNRTVNRHQQKSKQLMVHPINILIVKAVVVEL